MKKFRSNYDDDKYKLVRVGRLGLERSTGGSLTGTRPARNVINGMMRMMMRMISMVMVMVMVMVMMMMMRIPCIDGDGDEDGDGDSTLTRAKARWEC